MCSGPKTTASPPPPTAAVDKAAPPLPSSFLLELAASDDLSSFKHAVEAGLHPADASAPWYSRSVATRRMSLEPRTPLHIAALYGSTSVLRYLLSVLPASAASLPSGSDAATPLHLAAAGGSPCSLTAINLLLSASADINALDAAGHRPADLLPRHAPADLLLLPPSSPPKPSYPLDLTLPDIKTGIYGTDEFRIYTFKVKPCSRAYSHDWTECPFVHPGENARRRDPRKYMYSSIPCPEFRKSAACRNGDACEYAHGVFESWLHPAQYRTRLCKDETGCNRRVCFFAHKPEELRSVNPTAASVGMSLPSSPRSPSIDMAAAMMMMQQSGTPMSPSSLQLPSRLKTSLSARDLDFDGMDLMGLEGYLSSPRSNLSSSMRMNGSRASDYSELLGSLLSSPRSNLSSSMRINGSRASDYSELLGSLDRSVISQLQGLSMQQTATAAAQYQSMSQQMNSGYGSSSLGLDQSMSQQMNSGYGSSSLGLDHSTAKAIVNSRASAFAKRSQSFIDRGAVGRSSGLAAAPIGATSSGWGSPTGKLDWGIQGEELNKLRKSASFGIRSSNTGGGYGGSPAPAPTQDFDEPDVSWVHSLMQDGPAVRAVGQPQQKQFRQSSSDMLSPWAEQEQMVA